MAWVGVCDGLASVAEGFSCWQVGQSPLTASVQRRLLMEVFYCSRPMPPGSLDAFVEHALFRRLQENPVFPWHVGCRKATSCRRLQSALVRSPLALHIFRLSVQWVVAGLAKTSVSMDTTMASCAQQVRRRSLATRSDPRCISRY